MQKNKICVLKLGGECNFNCKHCHSKKITYRFNPDIIPYLKNNGFYRITYSGGEPLMYFDLIKKITLELGYDFQYKFVTNASLLREDQIDFLNEYNFSVFASYDGEAGVRDIVPPPRYDLLRLIKNHGLAITVYEENNNLRQLKKDVDWLIARNRIKRLPSFLPEFIHQTEQVSKNSTTLETAKSFILQLAPMLENEIVAFSIDENPELFRYYALYKACNKWWIKKNYNGLKCINDRLIPMTIDGRFLACPYGTNFVGNIYTGLDWKKIEEITPKKCKVCPIKDICKGSCWANKTSQECYIARTMHRWLDKVIDRRGVREKLEKKMLDWKAQVRAI